MSRFLALPLLPALLAAPLGAGELAVTADKLFGRAQTAAIGLQQGRYDAISPTGFGARGAVDLLDLKVFSLAITAAYHARTESDLKVDGKQVGSYDHQYAALGAQVEWRLLAHFVVGAEMRQEKLTTAFEGLRESTTYTRPWIRGGVGFSMPTPFVSPFVRLEVAYAVTRESSTASWDGLRKAMAPEYQVGLCAGIHF